jgi:hypothetical protein
MSNLHKHKHFFLQILPKTWTYNILSCQQMSAQNVKVLIN